MDDAHDEESAFLPRREKKFTGQIFIACILAASSGLMFGYAIGVSGGISSMDDFLDKFFPGVAQSKKHGDGKIHNYCQYSDQLLQLFTSSTYIFGLISTFGASHTTRALGRKPTMLIAGLLYFFGTIINTSAQNVTMLIVGRIFLGCGIGFGNQVAPLYLSEIAPPHLRGRLNLMFQLNITCAIFLANLINYATEQIHPWGWRLSVALGVIPSLILTLGSFLLYETPNSLIERGMLREGRMVLEKIRGTNDVQEELDDLIEAGKVASTTRSPFRDILKKKNFPPLFITMAMHFFQQATGINAIMFYAPVLFNTIGFGSTASLIFTFFVGFVNAICTVISMVVVDRFGRRLLLLEAGIQLTIAHIVIGTLLALGLQDSLNLLTEWQAYTLVAMIILFITGFAWSWGPIAWLVASEVFPLEVRSAGQSITVCTNLLFTFLMAQGCLTMLCGLQFGLFFMFAGFMVLMTLFVAFFLPETKGIPIEEMGMVWTRHWFWKRFVI